jgi:predicted enzyme related to lactoylglutathione lyase
VTEVAVQRDASTPALRFTGGYAKLPAQDVERARAFYADTLGLTPFHEQEGHLRYEVAGTQFLVFASSGSPSGTHDQFGFVVDDIDGVVATLRERGVHFETYGGLPMADGIAELGPVRAAWFKDSEGNLLSIAQFAGRS